MVVTIQFPNALMEAIEATKTSPFRFIVKENDQPFSSKESFENWFGGHRRDAGLSLNGHRLWKLSATLLAEGGGTAHELIARYGWANAKQAEHYTKTADRKRLGISSSSIISGQIENKISPHLEKDARKI